MRRNDNTDSYGLDNWLTHNTGRLALVGLRNVASVIIVQGFSLVYSGTFVILHSL